MYLPELHRVYGLLLDFVDLEGDNRVLAVVSPELILSGLGIPCLAVVLPIGVVLAVHRGEEVEALLHVAKADVLGEHGVAL